MSAFAVKTFKHVMKRYKADTKEGERIIVTMLGDPAFRVISIHEENDGYVLVFGLDGHDRECTLVMPSGSVALCIRTEEGIPERGSYGFLEARPDAS